MSISKSLLNIVKTTSIATSILASTTALAEDTYIIATEGAYAPFNYVNSDGTPDGYDIAVAKAVDEKLDDVKFEYQTVEWSSIFAGLEADRYDLVVSNVAKNPDREQKYLFSDVPYAWDIGGVVYKKGRTDIKGLPDLKDKTVSVAVGSSNAHTVEQWNKEHGDPIKVVYGEGEVSKAILDVQEGRVDATLADPVVAYNVIKTQGFDVEYAVRSEAEPVPVFLLLKKNEKGKKLKAKVDKALKELLEDGTLKKISEKYFGGDYSTKEAVLAKVGK